MGGSWGNVQDQNNSCKARPDVEEDGRVRGMDLGGSSIFVKIVEYVNSNARSDVEEGGRNGSGRLLWPPLPLSLTGGVERRLPTRTEPESKTKTETESRNRTKFETETRNKTETKTKSIKQSGGMKPLTDGC